MRVLVVAKGDKMGLLRNSLALLRPEQKATTAHSTIPTWTSGMPQVQPVSYERFAREGYQRNELVWACVDQLCTSVAEPRLKAYRKPSKPDGDPIPVEQHPILDLFERPNPFMSRTMYWQMAMMYRSIAGNGFVEKVRSRLGVVELWWWRPDRVKVIPDAKTFVKGYQIQVGADIFELPAADVIHFKNRTSLDEFYGMPPMQPAANRVDTDNYMREFTRSFFTNAGVPAGLLNIQMKQNAQERELIRARFRQDYAGPSGWHNLMVVDGTEASYTQMGMPLGDRGIAMPELDAINEARICACFGVPLSLVGAKLGMSSSSYANRVADQKSFWEITLIPIYREFAATINTYLVPEFDGVDYVEFDMDDVQALEEDRNEFHDRVRKDFTAGLLGRQQTRDLLGYPEPDKDDVYLVPVAMTPEPVTPEPEPAPAPVVSQVPELGPGVQPVDAQVPGKPIPPGQEPAPGGGIGAGEGNTQPGAR